MSLPTRNTRKSIAPKLEKEVEKMVEEESDDDDSLPPVLEKEAPIRRAGGAKKKSGPVNLAEALLNLSSGNENSAKDSFDPFPENFGQGLIADVSKPRILLPMRTNPLSQLATVLKPGTPLPMNRQYALQPAKPRPSKIVGSNSSVGPMKILEARKKEMEAGRRRGDAIMKNHRSLVEYNGGRPIQQFRRPATSSVPSSSAGPSTSNVDVLAMLRQQPSVKLDVSVGGSIQEHEARGPAQGEMSHEPILVSGVKGTITPNIILGAKVLDALKTMQARGPDEYNKFQTELFGLVMKYNVH